MRQPWVYTKKKTQFYVFSFLSDKKLTKSKQSIKKQLTIKKMYFFRKTILYFRKTAYYKHVRTVCLTQLSQGFSMTVYISNISYKATKQDIEALFETFGKVKNMTIPKDASKHRMRGYAFVELEDEQAETNIIDVLNNTQHMGRNIRVERANCEKSPYFA